MTAPESMTLREKFTEGERIARELVQHLEQGFIPKAHNVRKMTKPQMEAGEDEVRDITLRNAVGDVLASEEFAHPLIHRLRQFVTLIEQDVERIVREG
jgi:hypothetical protein